jgi:hypothetical protein
MSNITAKRVANLFKLVNEPRYNMLRLCIANEPIVGAGYFVADEQPTTKKQKGPKVNAKLGANSKRS